MRDIYPFWNSRYLVFTSFLVLLIIFIGGLTRLTQSGLSIVEWQLVTGILPPFSDTAWQQEFIKYQNFPEYKIINYDISLAQFKDIFLLEYFHRLLGRIIGIIILFPTCWYYFARTPKQLLSWPIILSFLVCIQGVAGWLMVKTGLKGDPQVSHYMLAFHLTLGFAIYSILWWHILKENLPLPVSNQNYNTLRKVTIGLLFCIFLQIIFGAAVAGLHGGLIYNNFPLMGESFIPAEINVINLQSLHNPAFIQFCHRIIAYIILILGIFIMISLLRIKRYLLALILILPIIMQITLGIITLLASCAVKFALAHQMGAALLLSSCFFVLYSIQTNKGNNYVST